MPRQKSDWVVRTHCGGAQVKWQSENLRRTHKTQRERSTWELPPSLYWSTSCTTLGCQSVQQTWLQQRIWSNPIAWRVSGTDYIHHAIRAILFQTTSFWNQFRAWSLPQGNDSYPVRSARSYCRHWWRPHQWKKSARTRRATAISTGKNARSRRHTQWEVRLFSWYHQVPRPHHFTGGNQSGFGQGWSHHQPPKTDQHSGVATTVRNGEPHWQIRTKSGWHHQASPWSPQERELVDLGHSTRDSISNTQETAEYHASVGTLQSWKGNKGVCRCIIIWTRRSPTPERRTRLEASLLCVQITDRHGAKVRPGGEGSAHSHLVLWEILWISDWTENVHDWNGSQAVAGLTEDQAFRRADPKNPTLPNENDAIFLSDETHRGKKSHDALSRAPGGVPAEQDRQMEVDTDMFVRSVIEGFPVTDQRLEEIRVKQAKDNICNHVMNFTKSHWPKKAKRDPALKPFWTVRDELTVQQGLLLFQSRPVIPTELQEDILQRLHQGHQGIVKCRALAKSSVWWPGLSKQIEAKISNCSVCEKERVLHLEPLQPTKTPDYPWQRVGMDLFEWKGHQYLLVVDYFSRWIEIAHLTQTTSSAVIEHVKAIFAHQGIPEVVVSDNGPQFNSRVFISFSENYGFTHLTSSPLHPQGNGEAERAVQTVKKLLKKADDPYVALLNYRATPLQHGSSPAELLMGRKLRTRVPTLPTQHVPDGRDMSKFQETDARLRLRQKIDYDRRHKVRPLPRLTDGQPVWVKTPGDAEAVVVGTSSTASTRSYNVRTERGIQRRDRYHLRRRDQQSSSGYDGVPKRTSTTIPSQSSQQTDQCDDQSDVQPDIQPQVANDGCAQRATVYTRSGRRVKIPERLNL